MLSVMIAPFTSIPPGPLDRETAAEINRALAELQRCLRTVVSPPLMLIETIDGYQLTLDNPDA